MDDNRTEVKFFYCYSYNLKNFLKLQRIGYVAEGKHENGNRYWVYVSNPELQDALGKWTLYKTYFKQEED